MSDLTRARDYFRGQADRGDVHADLWTRLCVICSTTLTSGRGVTCSKSCAARLREQRIAARRAGLPPQSRPECIADGCAKPVHAKSCCRKHYQRLLRNGDLKRRDLSMPEDRKRALWRWRAMIRRCIDPRADSYNRYGGRGIKICGRWMDFDFYWQDVGDPPEPGMTLDRIDNDGHYEPGNVRWATPTMQAANRKNRPDSCRRGKHPYRPETTYTYPDGRRSCCICNPHRQANPERYPAHVWPNGDQDTPVSGDDVQLDFPEVLL